MSDKSDTFANSQFENYFSNHRPKMLNFEHLDLAIVIFVEINIKSCNISALDFG